MSTDQTFSTGDLRSGAHEYNRSKEQRVKWAHGQVFGPGRREEDNHARPARVPFYAKPKDLGRGDPREKARVAVKKDINYASGDSSADESIDEASAAPVPDADITYSYDATRGPSQGSQILGLALAKAIERYEVRETDKLIKEYDVLDVTEAETPAPKVNTEGAEEEDYEFV